MPVFKPGELVLVYRPYQDSDGPNPKLLLPWRGPYVICSQLSPVVYRVRRQNETGEVSVHLAHIKRYYARKTPPAPDFDKLSEFFLGRQIPLPELDHPDEAQPKIESYVVDKVVNHKSGKGPKTPYNYRYRLRLRGYSPESDLEYRADEIPQCQEMIAAYRIRCGLDIAPPDKYSSRNPVEQSDPKSPSETRKRKRQQAKNPTKSSSRRLATQSDTEPLRKAKKRRGTLKKNSSLPPSRSATKQSAALPCRTSNRKRTRARKLND